MKLQRSSQTTGSDASRERRPSRSRLISRWLPAGVVFGGMGAWLGYQLARERLHWPGKRVLVAGASRGLGLVLARELARAGAFPIICGRDPETLYRAFDQLTELTDRALALPCDLTNADDVEDMVQTVERMWGPIDVLITNAGNIGVGPIETMTADDFRQEMEANFWSAVHPILAVTPRMRERGEGRVVNITSIGGKVSVPHLLPYSASKFALVGLSEGLRAELAKDGIKVTTVCPGLMRTGSPINAEFKGNHRAEFAWFSIGDSLPLFSMSAERAAQQILAACARGDAELVLTLPAKAAAIFHGLFPGVTADILALVNRVLPSSGKDGHVRHKGYESGSFASPSFFTRMSDSAAERNNEGADPAEPQTEQANGRAGEAQQW